MRPHAILPVFTLFSTLAATTPPPPSTLDLTPSSPASPTGHDAYPHSYTLKFRQAPGNINSLLFKVNDLIRLQPPENVITLDSVWAHNFFPPASHNGQRIAVSLLQPLSWGELALAIQTIEGLLDRRVLARLKMFTVVGKGVGAGAGRGRVAVVHLIY